MDRRGRFEYILVYIKSVRLYFADRFEIMRENITNMCLSLLNTRMAKCWRQNNNSGPEGREGSEIRSCLVPPVISTFRDLVYLFRTVYQTVTRWHSFSTMWNTVLSMMFRFVHYGQPRFRGQKNSSKTGAVVCGWRVPTENVGNFRNAVYNL